MDLSPSHASVFVEGVSQRVEKQQIGTCVRRGCNDDCADDSDYCAPHRDEQRDYNAEHMRRKRAEWDAADACMRCGSPRRKKGSRECVACLLKRGKLGVSQRVENKGDRLTSRLIPWENSPHNAGRLRLRGGKRGAPGIDEQDEFERKIVQAGIERYLKACEFLTSADGKAMLPADRDAARMAALGQLALASRAADDILDRNRYGQRLARADDRRTKDRYERDAKNQARLARLAAEFAKTGR